MALFQTNRYIHCRTLHTLHLSRTVTALRVASLAVTHTALQDSQASSGRVWSSTLPASPCASDTARRGQQTPSSASVDAATGALCLPRPIHLRRRCRCFFSGCAALLELQLQNPRPNSTRASCPSLLSPLSAGSGSGSGHDDHLIKSDRRFVVSSATHQSRLVLAVTHARTRAQTSFCLLYFPASLR